MKMILAIDNKTIEDELTKRYITKYNIYIVKTKDVIQAMISKDEEVILILRDDLTGEIETLDLLDELKDNKKIITIIIVKNVDNRIKEKLYSREVFNIIEGKKLKLQDILLSIENPKCLNTMQVEESKNNNIIFILGSSGCGKTIYSKILAQNVVRNTCKKVLVIDMDFINPCLDLYVNGAKNYSLIDYIRDVKASSVKEIKNYETIDNKNLNIRYILNQKSIGIPNDEITLQIFQILKTNYDYVLVDTSSYLIDKMYEIAKKLNSKIIYIIEPNIYLLKSINKNVLYNSIVVLNRYRENKEVTKFIKTSIDFPVQENIKKITNITNRIMNEKVNLKNVERIIGIKYYSKFQKIIKKIVFKEELK